MKQLSKGSLGPTLGAGCLTLFGLPFLGFGLFALWSLVSMLALAAQAARWVETPAKLLRVELEGNETWEATAEYQYTFEGQAYTNDRVGLAEGRDNLGSYQKRTHRRLKKAFEAGQTLPCYVDPSDPTRALLDRQLRPLRVLMWLPFVLGHGLVGAGLIWFAWRNRGTQAKRDRLRADAPDKPWLWRDDWAAGEIRSSDAGLFALAGFCFFWNLISFPIAAVVWTDAAERDWLALLVTSIFPVIGLGLLAWIGPGLLTRWRSGRTVLRLAKTPGVVGGKLSGVVLAPSWVGTAEEAKLTLTCSRTKGTGDDQTTYVAWQDTRYVTRFLDAGNPEQAGVPVDLTIPSDGVMSTDEEDRVHWTLTAEAHTPRGKFAATFEVPVFRTADSQEGITLDTEPANEFQRDVELVDLLEQEGVRVEALGSLDSVRYTSPPAQKWGEAIGLTIAGLVFAGVTIGMLWNGWWIGLGFGFFTPFFLYGALDSWLACSELTIAGQRWTVRSGWYGFRGEGQRFGPSEILSITSKKSNVQSTNTNKPSTKHVIATFDGGRKVILVRSVCGSAAVRKLLADLRHRAGHD